MKRITFLILTAVFIVSLSSCKNKGGGLFVPAEALGVIHINASSLSSKLSWDEIKNADWFKEMHPHDDDDTLLQKILDNPEASGIDTKSDFIGFFAQRASGGYTLFQGKVKDAKAFEAMNKKTMRGGKVATDGGYSIISTDSTAMVVWNDQKFAYVNSMPSFSAMNPYGNMRTGEMGRMPGADSLRKFAKNVLDGEGKSLYDDDRFTDLLKETGDVHFWFNSSAAMSGFGADMMSMMKVSSLIEGNAAGMVLSFDDGKITIKSKSYANKELAKLLEKYDTKNISADVLKRIPSQNVVGVMAANMNPQSLREILKAAGMDGLINAAAGKEGFTVDDVFAAINGQFLFAVSDLRVKDTIIGYQDSEGQLQHSFHSKKPDANLLFAVGVGNQGIFQKLFNLGTEKMGPAPFPYKLTAQWFAAGKEQSSVDGFLSGATVNQPWADKITGHPFGMYVDIQKILRSNLSGDSATDAFMRESASVWQDMVGTGGEFKNGTSSGEFTINFVDKKTNSLKQLNAYFNRANELRKTHMQRYMEEERLKNYSDSSATVPRVVPPAVDSDH